MLYRESIRIRIRISRRRRRRKKERRRRRRRRAFRAKLISELFCHPKNFTVFGREFGASK
jgi:hypothetical protein